MRKPKTGTTNRDDQIEAFATGADPALGEAVQDKEELSTLDPNAKHDFHHLRLGLNEYELKLLDTAAKQTNRSRLGFIRHAIKTLADIEKVSI